MPTRERVGREGGRGRGCTWAEYTAGRAAEVEPEEGRSSLLLTAAKLRDAPWVVVPGVLEESRGLRAEAPVDTRSVV